jgi:hypothetical protein
MKAAGARGGVGRFGGSDSRFRRRLEAGGAEVDVGFGVYAKFDAIQSAVSGNGSGTGREDE